MSDQPSAGSAAPKPGDTITVEFVRGFHDADQDTLDVPAEGLQQVVARGGVDYYFVGAYGHDPVTHTYATRAWIEQKSLASVDPTL